MEQIPTPMFLSDGIGCARPMLLHGSAVLHVWRKPACVVAPFLPKYAVGVQAPYQGDGQHLAICPIHGFNIQ